MYLSLHSASVVHGSVSNANRLDDLDLAYPTLSRIDRNSIVRQMVALLVRGMVNVVIDEEERIIQSCCYDVVGWPDRRLLVGMSCKKSKIL